MSRLRNFISPIPGLLIGAGFFADFQAEVWQRMDEARCLLNDMGCAVFVALIPHTAQPPVLGLDSQMSEQAGWRSTSLPTLFTLRASFHGVKPYLGGAKGREQT